MPKKKNITLPPLSDFPIVSIVTATRNRSHFLREFLASIEQQTYSHWEAIIVDDNSKDETPKVVREFSDKHPSKVRSICLSSNKGFTTAVKEGIRQCRGSLVMFMGDDDILMPRMFEKGVEAFKRNPELGLVYANLWHGQRLGERRRLPLSYQGVQGRSISAEEYIDMELQKIRILPQSTMFRRDVYESLGGLKEEFLQDTDLFFRISMNYPILYIPDTLAFHRRHESNITEEKKDIFLQATVNFWKKQVITYGETLSFKRKVQQHILALRIRNTKSYLKDGKLNYTKFRQGVRDMFLDQKLYRSWRPYSYLLLSLFPEELFLFLKKIKRFFYQKRSQLCVAL